MLIYDDASSNIANKYDNSISHKVVFRLWASQVYAEDGEEQGCLTQDQIQNLFPEFKAKLQLYANCCDREGKIVKNQAYYNEYKMEPHNASTRGGKNKNKEVNQIYQQRNK